MFHYARALERELANVCIQSMRGLDPGKVL